MRPSDLKAARTPTVEDDGKKKYASSVRADPPITEAEARADPAPECERRLLQRTHGSWGGLFFLARAKP
jgi:hypothetical protein